MKKTRITIGSRINPNDYIEAMTEKFKNEKSFMTFSIEFLGLKDGRNLYEVTTFGQAETFFYALGGYTYEYITKYTEK